MLAGCQLCLASASTAWARLALPGLCAGAAARHHPIQQLWEQLFFPGGDEQGDCLRARGGSQQWRIQGHKLARKGAGGGGSSAPSPMTHPPCRDEHELTGSSTEQPHSGQLARNSPPPAARPPQSGAADRWECPATAQPALQGERRVRGGGGPLAPGRCIRPRPSSAAQAARPAAEVGGSELKSSPQTGRQLTRWVAHLCRTPAAAGRHPARPGGGLPCWLAASRWRRRCRRDASARRSRTLSCRSPGAACCRSGGGGQWGGGGEGGQR